MIIALDFDGTCVTNEYPRIGKDIGAVPVLKELIENGHQLIVFTMRSDFNDVSDSTKRNYLEDAINWFHKNKLPLYGIQINPTQHSWTQSPKVFADIYIDDAALGCPLIEQRILFDSKMKNFGPQCVDWTIVRKILIKKGVIKRPARSKFKLFNNIKSEFKAQIQIEYE